MVVYDEKKISNGDYVHAYSDSGKYIVRITDGVAFGHCWFPKEQGFRFDEGDIINPPVPDPEIDDDEALQIIMGGTQ